MGVWGGGAENAGVENVVVDKVWKVVTRSTWFGIPQFPRVRTNNLEHTPQDLRSAHIAETLRCRVGQLWPKVEDCNWNADIIGLSSTTVT